MDANIPDGFQLDAPIQAPVSAGMSNSASNSMPDGFQLDEVHDAQYGGAGQGVQSAVEGALGPLAGPGVDLPGAPGLKTGLGIGSNEAIRGRAEAHPIAHTAGELAGLALGPEGTAIDALGVGAERLAGLGAETYAARVGSSAIKAATEMAAFQTGDEVTKMVLQDPNAGAQSAIANIGLAAVLGAGGGAFFTGAVSPLWKAAEGSKIAEGLSALTERLGGKEGDALVGNSSRLEAEAGVQLQPEFKAVIDRKTGAMSLHSTLSQTDTTFAGRSYQKKLGEQLDTLNEKVLDNLGHTSESANGLEAIDKFSRGREFGDSLVKEIEPLAKQMNTRYEAVNDKLKDATLSVADRSTISERIAQKSIDEGWHKAESDAQANLAARINEKLNSQATVADLKKFLTNLSDSHPYGSPTYQAAKDIGRIIRDQQEKIIMSKLGPEELTGYNALRGDYKTMMNKFDDLNEHLHIGRYDGPQGFINALKEKIGINPEGVLNSLSGKSKADVLEQLKLFPETLEKVKQFHTDQFIKNSMDNGKISVSKLLNNIENKNVSPQIRNLVMNPEQQNQVSAIKQILNGLHDPTKNWSNSARTIQKLAHDTPSVLSFIAAMMGHAEAGVIGFLGKMGFSEGKDAIKLGMLKFLGSEKAINPEAFKAAVSYMDKAQKGARVISKASENVFKPGVRVLMSSQMPSPAQLEKLDKLVAKNDPKNTNQVMMAQEGPLGHYMPDHQTALTAASLQSLQYLKSVKPQPIQLHPLDTPIQPTPAQEARYNRALEIAQQPATVLQHIKDGTIVPTDIHDLRSMYPALYEHLAQKLSNDMISHHSEENPIPYKTRMGLSHFLGQPMDSSMLPTSIMAAQPKPKPMGPPQPAGSRSKSGSPSKMNAKTAKSYQTADQSAESDRGGRGD